MKCFDPRNDFGPFDDTDMGQVFAVHFY